MQKGAFFSVLASRKGIYKVFEMIGSELVILEVIVAICIIVINLFSPVLSAVNADKLFEKRQRPVVVLLLIVSHCRIKLGFAISAFENFLVFTARGEQCKRSQ